MGPRTDPDTEAAEVADLRRHRWIAHGCLAAAAAGWAASHALPLPSDAAHLLRAVAEAGLVGGLADWFAVTALFRRPLGLPIPHTALVPQNRRRIAEGIANYIDREFLEPGVLVEQVRRLDLADRLAGLLRLPETRERIVELTLGLLPGLVRDDQEAAIRGTLRRALQDAVRDVDLRRPMAQVLRAVVESDALEALIRELSDRLVMMVQDRRGWLQDAVEARSRWWIPKAVDRRVAGNLADAAITHLFDLRSPVTDVGRDLRRFLAELPDEVEQGGPLGQRLTKAVQAALQDSSFGQLLEKAMATLRRLALEDLDRHDGRIRAAVEAAVDSLAAQLDDAALRTRVNASLEEAFLAAIPRWRLRIRQFVSATLLAQDATEFTARLERRVGKDLQYIRINGTLLGAAIGGVLYALNTLLS